MAKKKKKKRLMKVADFKHIYELTVEQIREITKTSNPRTVYSWLTKDKVNRRKPHPACLELLRLYCAELEPLHDRKKAKKKKDKGGKRVKAKSGKGKSAVSKKSSPKKKVKKIGKGSKIKKKGKKK